MAACPTCGQALESVSAASLERHIAEDRDIVCMNCGPHPAKHWRDGRPETKAEAMAEEKARADAVKAKEEAEKARQAALDKAAAKKLEEAEKAQAERRGKLPYEDEEKKGLFGAEVKK